MHVLPPCCLWREKVAERRAILRGWVLPIALDRIPALAQPLLICVAILRDDRGDPLRMARREAEADRGAVIEDVDGIPGEPGDGREPVDDLGEVIKGVPELRPLRRLGETETWQVGGDHMVVVRQGRDQVAEHMGRRWKSMKQQQRWRRVGPRFPIEDLKAIHLDEAVPCLAQLVRQGKSHGYPPSFGTLWAQPHEPR